MASSPSADSASWGRVKEVFQEAFGMPPAEREAFLQQACGADAPLRREVLRLLEAHDRAEGFLAQSSPVLPDFGPPEETSPSRDRIGPYRIVKEVGRGGMGSVYLAERDEAGFRKTVAVKLVRAGMEAGFVLRRFQTERQILASLEHQGIARLYDGGTTEDGLPYFVMEYVEGENVLDYCDARRLPIRDRLQLFRRVCDAVQYAHQNLVVHRDLKPSNIPVTAEGEPKLLDFGIAKLLGPESGGPGAEETATLMRLMTPDYASPEQVRGERVTTASDVYALGVVLYELLTGHRPYRIRGRQSAEIERVVCETDPERPSTMAGRRETFTSKDGHTTAIAPETVAANRTTTRSRLRRLLRGDLDNIVSKALEKDPARRYATAAELGDDLRRHLDGFPVRAQPDRRAYRAAKFVRRHRPGVAAAAAAAVALTGGLGVALWQAKVARAERAAAEQHFGEVRAMSNSLLFEFYDMIRNLPGAIPARELLVKRAQEYLEKLARRRGGDLSLSRELAEAYRRLADVQGGIFGGNLGDTEGARRSLEKAVAIREAIVASGKAEIADRRALASTYLSVGQILVAAGDSSRAVRASRKAVAILERLSAAAPADRTLRRELGGAFRSLGHALATAGDTAAALERLRGATRIFEGLQAADPSDASSRRHLAITDQMMLWALSRTGSGEAVSETYERAVSIFRDLRSADAANPELARELAFTHATMGYLLGERGEAGAALECHRKALEIRKLLAEDDPRNADARLQLATTYNDLGWILGNIGQTGPALKNLSAARTLAEKVTSSDPANARARQILAALYDSLGAAHHVASSKEKTRSGRAAHLRDALAWYRRSQAVYLDLRASGKLAGTALPDFEDTTRKLAACEAALEGLGGR